MTNTLKKYEFKRKCWENSDDFYEGRSRTLVFGSVTEFIIINILEIE